MLRLATDEDFNGRIYDGLRARIPNLDIVRVQDADLTQKDDPDVLEWAASQGRVLLTHDVTTMIHHASERIRAGLPMPGLFGVRQSLPIGEAIDEIELVAVLSEEGEYEWRILFLPLRKPGEMLIQ